MKTSIVLAAATLAGALSMPAMPAWAGSVGVGRTEAQAQTSATQTQVDPQLIASLQEASEKAIRDGRNGNKNNPAFGQKAAQIDDLIDRLKSGQKVDPSEIDQAFEPVHVW